MSIAHVAIIMDGNGRWAARRGRPRWMGHVKGAQVVRDVVAHCARQGIGQLTQNVVRRQEGRTEVDRCVYR